MLQKRRLNQLKILSVMLVVRLILPLSYPILVLMLLATRSKAMDLEAFTNTTSLLLIFLIIASGSEFSSSIFFQSGREVTFSVFIPALIAPSALTLPNSPIVNKESAAAATLPTRR